MITREYLSKLLHYDPITGHFTWLPRDGNRWFKRFVGKVAGSVNFWGYVVIRLPDGKLYPAHRLAWLYMTGEMPDDLIDHADMNRANNAWENLRPANRSQNAANTGRRSDANLALPKGVSRSRKRFKAEITCGGKKQHLGVFDTPEAAGVAYQKKAAELFGEFYRES